jgi:hypothetical protein
LIKNNNPIKHIAYNNIIIFLIVTVFSSWKCYSIENNDIQSTPRLPVYLETTINTTAEPDKPPPSYADAISERSNNILPTYQQALIMGDESIRTQEDITLTEEAVTSNFSQAVVLNIPIEHSDNITRGGNCFCAFLQKNTLIILIRVFPYIIPVIIMSIYTKNFKVLY